MTSENLSYFWAWTQPNGTDLFLNSLTLFLTLSKRPPFLRLKWTKVSQVASLGTSESLADQQVTAKGFLVCLDRTQRAHDQTSAIAKPGSDAVSESLVPRLRMVLVVEWFINFWRSEEQSNISRHNATLRFCTWTYHISLLFYLFLFI